MSVTIDGSPRRADDGASRVLNLVAIASSTLLLLPSNASKSIVIVSDGLCAARQCTALCSSGVAGVASVPRTRKFDLLTLRLRRSDIALHVLLVRAHKPCLYYTNVFTVRVFLI